MMLTKVFLFFNVDPIPVAVLFSKFQNPSVMKENRAFPETDFHESAGPSVPRQT